METTFNYTDYSQLTAQTGIANISTANPNLDGTGTMAQLLTGAAKGTIINSLIVKATQTVSQGMVRFFIRNSGSTQLLSEVVVPATTPTAVQPSFEARVSCAVNLAAGNQLWVSTEKGESFNVIAEALDWEYPETPACCDHMQRQATNGFDSVSTANTNLNGSGAIVDILTASSKGTALETVHIKAQGDTSEGMIRLFLSKDGGTTYFLFTEIQIPASRQTAIVPSTINQTIPYSLLLQDTYIVAASTEQAETISLVMDGLSWGY